MDDIRIAQPLESTSSDGPVTSISVALGSTQLSQDTLVVNLVSRGLCQACGSVGGDSSSVDLSLLADAIVERLRQRSTQPTRAYWPRVLTRFPRFSLATSIPEPQGFPAKPPPEGRKKLRSKTGCITVGPPIGRFVPCETKREFTFSVELAEQNVTR